MESLNSHEREKMISRASLIQWWVKEMLGLLGRIIGAVVKDAAKESAKDAIISAAFHAVSPKIGSLAGSVLGKKDSTDREKSLAGSLLSQIANEKKKKK